MNSETIKVLIVDDSPLTCQILKKILSSDPEVKVIGIAGDPYEAREQIEREVPDVITLDLEMPRMDGLTFLRKIMKYFPLPVVIVSGLTTDNIRMSLEALSLGAVDVVNKPDGNMSESIYQVQSELIAKVKGAAGSRIAASGPRVVTGQAGPAVTRPASGGATAKVIAIGTSTGGTLALNTILPALPENIPPLVIVQHLPLPHIPVLVENLDQMSRINVTAITKERFLDPGTAYIACCDSHVLLSGKAGMYSVRLKDGPVVCHNRPSIEVLFQSVARVAGLHALGMILTGMGKDGAEGLLAIMKAGGQTLVQDRESSVIFGMPAEAIRLGAAQKTLPLDQIAGEMLRFAGMHSGLGQTAGVQHPDRQV